jgi:phosphate transport system substrate-binding protein
MKTSIAGIILVSALFLFSCGSGNSKKAPIDTPTSGTISIAVDEAFMPFMQSEITAFQGTYTKAKILAYYVSEKRAFELLMKDSVRLVVSNRSFSEAELAEFKKQTITPKFLKIATDALGVVLNNSNPDTLLTTDHLRQILTTENWVWKNLSGKGISKPVELVLDKEGTSNYASVLSKLNLKPEEIRCKITFAGGDREVINYVNQHPASIGFMGVNWISDPDDPTQMRFKAGVKVAHLMSDTLLTLHKQNPMLHNEEYYQPLQAYLAQHFYPLTRDVIVASREARSGLGTGFLAWLAGDKGQRIILKAGLLPATMPIRLVKVKKDNDLTN